MTAEWPPPQPRAGILGRIRDLAFTVTAVGSAVGTVYALLRFAGPVIAAVTVSVAAGAIAAWLAWLVVRELRELGSAVKLVERHLASNGHEALLPDELHEDLGDEPPLRDIVAWLARTAIEMLDRLRSGDTWMREHQGWADDQLTELRGRVVRLEGYHPSDAEPAT